MKNIFFVSLMIGIICFLPSCLNPCKHTGGYLLQVGSQLKKCSFKPGSYWIYQDSVSGIIDSQSVYYYSAQNDVSIGDEWNDGVDCTVYGDAFSMSVASFWNGVSHDSIFWGNENGHSGPEIIISYSSNPQQAVYAYSSDGYYLTDTLTNFIVSGQTFPKVYLSSPGSYPLVYRVDNVGVVKWVFNDTINGQHTWNLLRYHVINP